MLRLRTLLALLPSMFGPGALGLGPGRSELRDEDRDGDGLSDFQELHKYLTDPDRADTDGDGIPDGDWDERREFQYTVTSVLRVLRPFTLDCLCDDYQDARILVENERFVEVEVVHYPLNTVGDAIEADPDWRTHLAERADLAALRAPGVTANWDAEMAVELANALAADCGLDTATADDESLARGTARWILDHTRFEDGFTTFCASFENGRAEVFPGLESVVEHQLEGLRHDLEEQWQRELFARGMFERRVHGSCTSSAILWTGCLRALGLPTRTILCTPVVDASDSEQRRWVDEHLHHHQVRDIVRRALHPLASSWSSHTYNEVFVGGRWHRLNYARLGQNILDADYFGLMTHVATFADWADADAARTIGLRQHGHGTRDEWFPGVNPYTALSLHDEFGVHAKIENPAVPEHRVLTIDRLAWWNSPERSFGLALDDPRSAGYVLVHVAEVFPEQSSAQYQFFYDGVDREFVLRADGLPDVRAHAVRGWWCDPRTTLRDFLLRIEPQDLPSLQIGVPYSLVPRNANEPERWAVAESLSLVRRTEGDPYALEPTPTDVTGLTLEEFLGSEDPALPEMVRDFLRHEMPNALVARCRDWDDFAHVKHMTREADPQFFLEAPGADSVPIHIAVVGGYSSRDARGPYAFVYLRPADESRPVRPGVEYRVRARNEIPGFLWTVPDWVRLKVPQKPRDG